VNSILSLSAHWPGEARRKWHAVRWTSAALGGAARRNKLTKERFLKNPSLFSLVLKGLALAMSVAVVVLGILGTATPQTLISLLTVGLLALAVLAFQTKG
jgi:hypothetical protein